MLADDLRQPKGQRESWASEMRPGRTGVGCAETTQGDKIYLLQLQSVHRGCLACRNQVPEKCLRDVQAGVRTRFSRMHMHRGQDTACTGSRSRHEPPLLPAQTPGGSQLLPSPSRTPGMVARHHHMSLPYHLPRRCKQSQATIAAPLGFQEWSRAASMPTVLKLGADTCSLPSYTYQGLW